MATQQFQSLQADVITLTARPDLDAETILAIKTATRSIHSRFEFPRDIATQAISFGVQQLVSILDVVTLLPRFRTLSSVRATDATGRPLDNIVIDIRELRDIYDPVYGTPMNNIAYMAGSNLTIKTYPAIYGVILEYFQMPDVSENTYSSWIAALIPDAIIYAAASIVFKSSGNDEKAAQMDRFVQGNLVPELIAQYGVLAGR